MNIKQISDLTNHIMRDVRNINDQELVFTLENGDEHKLYHDQDCCESVYIADIEGDLRDLIGVPLLVSEEVSSEGVNCENCYEESYTWTFYRFATIKGYVTVRWLGQSSGEYSESVDFI